MTSYTNIFGGNPVLPADVSYRKITLVDDENLVWTTDFNDSNKFTAHIMDVNVQTANKRVFLPDATLVSVGTSFLFVNVSVESFSLVTFGGDELVPVFSTGQSYYCYLTDNTTQDGSWRLVPLGAGSVVPAIMSVGAEVNGIGLKIIGSPITPPGGVLTFEVDENLQNIVTESQKTGQNVGFLILKPTGEYVFRLLEEGDGIKIDNPGGVDGPSRISFDSSILPPPSSPGIASITIKPDNKALHITGSPAVPPTANFSIGVNDAIGDLVELSQSDFGFIVHNSDESPHYQIRNLQAGKGITIQNEDGYSGNPSFSIDPNIVPVRGNVVENLSITSSGSAIRISGSPTTGANPKITLTPDIDVQALADGNMINHKQIMVAAGAYNDGVFTGVLNVKNIVKTDPNTYQISFVSSNIRKKESNCFFNVMTNSNTNWWANNRPFTETSTLFFSSPDVNFAFIAWAL